jgi:hypothetical protein
MAAPDRPLTKTELAMVRLHQHSLEVLKRMERGILLQVDKSEMDRLLDKREAYRQKIKVEMENLHARLEAQARHERSLQDPNRKIHKKRGNRNNNRAPVERVVMRRFPMR